MPLYFPCPETSADSAGSSAPPNGTGVSFYGPGFDGDLNFDGVSTVLGFNSMSFAPSAATYSLNRDICASNMTVGGNAIVQTQGFRIFVTNFLTVSGTIRNSGVDGSAGTVGGAGSGGAGANGTGPLGGGLNGGDGGAPNGTTGGAGNQGQAQALTHLGAVTGTVAAGASGLTLQGGGGGANNSGTAGATVAGATLSLSAGGHFWSPASFINGRNVSNNQVLAGSSGGGGRGGGADATGGGGGGGGSAGTVGIYARQIIGTGSIQARGGAGGAGHTRGGGGGGGSGGVLVIVTDSDYPLSVQLIVSGGAAGAAGGSFSSTAGGAGGPGILHLLRP